MSEKRSYLKDQHGDPAGEEPRRQVTDALRARQAAGPGCVLTAHARFSRTAGPQQPEGRHQLLLDAQWDGPDPQL